MKVGGEGDYIPIATLSPPEIQCFIVVRDKVTRQCSQTTTVEEKGEPKQIRTEVSLLTRLTPYR